MREVPNGVNIGGLGSGGEGKPDGNRIRIVHENNVVRSPLCCPADSDQTTIQPVCGTPTYDVPAENDTAEDDTNGGHPSDFKTPEPRPTGVSDSCAGRNPSHRRARGGSGTDNANSSTAGGSGGRGGYGAGEKRDGGVVAQETSYRMQLLLSAQQREAAERMGVGRTSETRAAATSAAGEGRGDDVINVSCCANDGCDMYQLGRMEGGENDFAVRGPLHQSKPGGKVCGPVSRYAVRLLVDRTSPHRCRIFAGGFNSR